MKDTDEFGNRMKSYEAVETGRRLDVHLPIYARIDGRSFSKFTRFMERPFDVGMHQAMCRATETLLRETHARIGYTQSDEISLVWLAEHENASVFFDGKIQKMVSTLAGLASVSFYKAAFDIWGWNVADKMPHFDCRVFQLPSRTEAANTFLWREADATKNAIQMAAQVNFSHKALMNKSGKDMIAMLAAKGIDFEHHFPTWCRHGSWLRRVTVQRTLKADELESIPEKHRPDPGALVERTEVQFITMPSFRTVGNREAVIFDGAKPEQNLTLNDGLIK